MIWSDTISSILDIVNGQSLYNTSRNTTPDSLGLKIVNQAKDWLCQYKPWADLVSKYTAAVDENRQISLPTDFGCMIYVYTDPAGVGKPTWYYYLNDNDIAKRYEFTSTYDTSFGFTRKISFPNTTYLAGNPTVVYSRVIEDYTNEYEEISFFPAGIMILVCKKLLQDFYGIGSQDNPQWINGRIQEELRMLEGYAYNSNVCLDMSIKDTFGNPIRIPGTSFDGSQQKLTTPSPFMPSTFFTGGTM